MTPADDEPVVHLTPDERENLAAELERAVNLALLAIGLRHRDAGTCFNCYIKAEICGLVAVLIADIVAWVELEPDPPRRDQYVADVLAVIRTELGAARALSQGAGGTPQGPGIH